MDSVTDKLGYPSFVNDDDQVDSIFAAVSIYTVRVFTCLFSVISTRVFAPMAERSSTWQR